MTIVDIPFYKQPTASRDWDKLNPNDEDIWQAKLDGAFLYLTFDRDEGVRAFSYRRSKRDGKPIEHTQKIYGLKRVKVPEALNGAILSGEAWHPNLASREIGGILNTRKEELPESLFVALHGINKFPDIKPGQLSAEEELNILKGIHQEFPVFELPDTAITPEQKTKLLKEIQSGKHPQTKEGIIGFPGRGQPYKAVLEPTYDLPVVGVSHGMGQFQDRGIGAILVGDTENPTAVGTGLSHHAREVIYQNPELVDGLVARVKAKEVFPSGKLRAPVLLDFHPEKSDPDKLKQLEAKLIKTAVIKQEGENFVLYTKDGSRVLGHHTSREKALRQERAIQLSKRFRTNR
jgi:hypothetical protein